MQERWFPYREAAEISWANEKVQVLPLFVFQPQGMCLFEPACKHCAIANTCYCRVAFLIPVLCTWHVIASIPNACKMNLSGKSVLVFACSYLFFALFFISLCSINFDHYFNFHWPFTVISTFCTFFLFWVVFLPQISYTYTTAATECLSTANDTSCCHSWRSW